ncbi:F0F1 ATP synthase subunit delta [Bacillus massilinigeriensis]|uniref:F0F1 ATP synthase subunit delta n=1 Tax=Bacillus mediterraneensis TaxID=1805474 RepID=UPI0008F8E7F9|nr:F0F1 ATP synthase subunit delta [Bacillus mediterraneensis]
MSNPQLAKRYAQALFQVASEHQAAGTVEEELRVVKQVVENNPGLTSVLSSPKLTLEKKKELLKQAFASASPFVQNLLMILVDRHRESQIAEVADKYIELSNESKGIAEAVVYTVQPLTGPQEEAISLGFAPQVGKLKLQIQNITDPNLLGGAKLRIGNRIFDGSLRGKLDRLERKLLG